MIVKYPHQHQLRRTSSCHSLVSWADPSSDARLNKRIVRTLIHEVIADIEPQAGEIIPVLHWVGGVHTEFCLPRRRRRQCKSTAVEIIEAVRVLVRIAGDDLIAGLLNRNSLKPATE